MFPRDSFGEQLGRYEVVRKLATGGMAEIYLARIHGAAGFERLCVLKRIPPALAQDRRMVAMFLDEARLSASLHHPNIADVFDLGNDGGSYFFAMEYIHGQDARALRLQAHAIQRPIPLEIAVAITHDVALALAYAHDKVGPNGPLQLVHRDVSPGNILVSYDGAVKLVDFGIARATSRTSGVSTPSKAGGGVRGKIPYLAPEQCTGQPVDRRSDLFSLGVVIYELTVGCRPFRGTSEFAIMERIVNRSPRLPSAVIAGYPLELEMIVMKLLARHPNDRYQTAGQLSTDLGDCATRLRMSVTQLAVAKYMRSMFPGEVAAWERASKHGTSLVQHLSDTVGTPVARPVIDSPAYGVVVVHTERADTVELTEDDVLQSSDSEPTAERTSPMRRAPATDELLGYQRIARVPSRDFTMDDPTYQAKPEMTAQSTERTVSDAMAFDPIEQYRAEILDQVTNQTLTDPSARALRRFEGLLARAWQSHEAKEHEKALIAVELALSEDPEDTVDPELHERYTATITTIFEAFLGDRSRQPALAHQLEDLAMLPIAPEAAFLLSRIDGLISLDDLLDISGMPRLEACRHLCQLYLLGILQ